MDCQKCNKQESSVRNGKLKDGRQVFYCKFCKISFRETPKKERSTKNKLRILKKNKEFILFKKLLPTNGEALNLSETSRSLKITRRTIGRWIQRLKKEGLSVSVSKKTKSSTLSLKNEQKLKSYFESLKKLG